MASPTTDIEVLDRLVPVAGRDVVDVGCGGGSLARELAARGARITALEVSDDQLAAARTAEDGAGITYGIGRAEALPLPDSSQDVVVLMRSLHHVGIEDMGAALGEARRVLRDAGAVYVAEPLPEGDFFAMVSVLENETQVREAARAAIDAAGDHGLTRTGGERYAVASVLADLDAFVARMLAVNPDRAALVQARRPELERMFAAGGEDTSDGRKRFLQLQRADVLRPALMSFVG